MQSNEKLKEKLEKLGKRQKALLCSLCEHGSWPGGWTWYSPSTMRQILDGLVKRDLAYVTINKVERYGRVYEKPVYYAKPEISNLHRHGVVLRAMERAKKRKAESDALKQEQYEKGTHYVEMVARVQALQTKLADVLSEEDRRVVKVYGEALVNNLADTEKLLKCITDAIRRGA